MTDAIQPLTLDAWDARYTRLKAAGLDEPPYGGPLSRHLCDGDTRLAHLRFDSSAAALDLWNFLLTEEMLALHFCSDRAESLRVLEGLLREVRRRVSGGVGMAGGDRVRVFWVNPVADLRAMNLLEECGGRLCGTEFLFSHALDEIPADVPPFEALARMALADPMVGPTEERVARICRDASRFGAEAVIVSRIPGASHCALEAGVVCDRAERELGLPVAEIEVPPLSDALLPALRTRIEALVEVAEQRRAT